MSDDEPVKETGEEPDERHHVRVDSDERPALEADEPSPSPGPDSKGGSKAGSKDDSEAGGDDDDEIRPARGFGGPEDPSDEQPMLLTSPSDEAPALPGGGEPPSELQQAYECLELRTPIDEFLAFAEARRETLVRLGDVERSAVAAEALETGLRALREVMGAVPAARREAQ